MNEVKGIKRKPRIRFSVNRIKLDEGIAEGDTTLFENTNIVPTPLSYLKLYKQDDEFATAVDQIAVFVAGESITFSCSNEEWETKLNQFLDLIDIQLLTHLIEITRLVMGNFFAIMIDEDVDNEFGLALQILPPENMTPKTDKYRNLIKWKYSYYDIDSEEQKEDPLDKSNVIHIPYRTIGTDIMGVGLAHQVIDLSNAQNELEKLVHLMVYRATHALLWAKALIYAHQIDDINQDADGKTDADKLIEAINTALKGRITEDSTTELPTAIINNITTDDDCELQAIEMKNDISGAMKLMEFYENRKVKALRVPKFLTMGEGANRATSYNQLIGLMPYIRFEQKSIKQRLFDQKIIPKLRKLLNIPNDLDIKVIFKQLLKEDEKSTAETTKILVDAGVINTNEARNRHNYSEVQEFSDEAINAELEE